MNEPMVVKCCVCSKLRIKVDGVQVWLHAVAAGHSLISHTYCDDCKESELAKFEDELASECSG